MLMKKFMKTWVFCTLAVVAMCGCSEGFDDGADWNEQQIAETRTATATDVVYHEGTESCLVPRNDPYTLANFRQALSNLKQGRSTQTLTTAQSAAIAQVADLSATHYALKIYPRTESEQWAISRMEDIQISYTPFDYVMLPKEQSDALRAAKSSIPTHPDVSRYTVTYENMRTVEGPVSAQSFDMPVMYVVWPCSKPLPQGYDYEIDYEVYLPSYDSAENGNVATRNTVLVNDVVQILEQEAIRLVVGGDLPIIGIIPTRTVSGHIYEYDTYMDRIVPMCNLYVQLQMGTSVLSTYTDNYGRFSITNRIPDGASLSVLFTHPKWMITSYVDTYPTILHMGSVDATYPSSGKTFTLSQQNYPSCEIHRAVDYYYHGDHEFVPRIREDGIILRARDQSNANGNFGLFHYGNNEYIEVFNLHRYMDSYVVGCTLHELGHFTHLGERGGNTNFSNVHYMIAESYASYVGWYLCGEYYKYIGAQFDDSENITGQNRQAWVKTFACANPLYSPLFIDLFDDYNQSVDDADCNYDILNMFSHATMKRIAAQGFNWEYVYGILLDEAGDYGRYYTESELNTYVQPYNYWFANVNINHY